MSDLILMYDYYKREWETCPIWTEEDRAYEAQCGFMARLYLRLIEQMAEG